MWSHSRKFYDNLSIYCRYYIYNIRNNYQIIITNIYRVLAPIFCFTCLWNHDANAIKIEKKVYCSFLSSMGCNALNTQ